MHAATIAAECCRQALRFMFLLTIFDLHLAGEIAIFIMGSPWPDFRDSLTSQSHAICLRINLRPNDVRFANSSELPAAWALGCVGTGDRVLTLFDARVPGDAWLSSVTCKKLELKIKTSKEMYLLCLS